MSHVVRTCLWFNGRGLEAATFYTSLLPNSRLARDYDPVSTPMIVEFTLGGAPFQILDAGPAHPPTEAASIAVSTPDQAETDRLWHALTADGGTESQCGWLKDRFGVSWQIVPDALPRLMAQPDRAAAGRVMQALLGMRKIDVATLEAAARG
jgi:predicted 3-demethylubiquinone-9 3-methyltransferase (glyoxalase superfamily)